MAHSNITILVPIDLTPGAAAVNYEPSESFICPVLSLLCIGASGSGTIKLTPLKAADAQLGVTSGSGGRLRIATTSTGALSTVEIASGGSGYIDGPIAVNIVDPYGTGGSIACTASGGEIVSASIVSTGINYSGYVTMNIDDFIEGVSYDIIPRFIEQTGGSGVLTLLGEKLGTRPFQVF